MKLFDTNIVIQELKNGEYQHGEISVLTLIEILRGVPEEKRDSLKENLEELYIIQSISNPVILEYCRLYSSLKDEGKILPDADLIIAATALTESIVLVSKDPDFEKIQKYGLTLNSE